MGPLAQLVKGMSALCRTDGKERSYGKALVLCKRPL